MRVCVLTRARMTYILMVFGITIWHLISIFASVIRQNVLVGHKDIPVMRCSVTKVFINI